MNLPVFVVVLLSVQCTTIFSFFVYFFDPTTGIGMVVVGLLAGAVVVIVFSFFD